MGFRTNERSLTEVIIAVTLICFLIGFVTVLCLGNYYRAKRAMERQRQRRLAKLSGGGGNGVVGLEDSPASTTERQSLLMTTTSSFASRRRPPSTPSRTLMDDEGVDSLLLDVHGDGTSSGAM